MLRQKIRVRQGQVFENDEKAFYWCSKAAEQGNAWGQYNVGRCYSEGKGVAQDYEKAFDWYLKATGQGHDGAQFNVGHCYYYGEGVTQDDKKGFDYFKILPKKVISAVKKSI